MYFVSNRSGGFGESDIWIVYVISTRFGISENLGADINIDRKTRNIIVDDSLSLFEKDYTAKSTTNRMNDGYQGFNTEYECDETCRLKVEKKDYHTKEEVVVINDETGVTEVTIVLDPVIPEPKFKEGDDLFKILKLNPIHFDFDKWNIRPDAAVELQKIVDVMKLHPTVKIDVRSFTDSRGK